MRVANFSWRSSITSILVTRVGAVASPIFNGSMWPVDVLGHIGDIIGVIIGMDENNLVVERRACGGKTPKKTTPDGRKNR